MFIKNHRSASARMALVFALIVGVLVAHPILAAPSLDFASAKSMGADQVSTVDVGGSGSIYTSGSFFGTTDFDPGAGTYHLTPAGSRDIFINKLDSQGGFLWAKQIGGTDLDFSLALTLDSNENLYMTGHFRGTADFDPGPGTYNLTSAGENDIFICKLDSNGSFLWAKRMGSTLGDLGTAINLDASGNVYTAGFFGGTVDFDPGAGTFNLTSSGSNDIFISKLDNNGNFLLAKRIGGSADDRGRDMVLDADGNIFATGVFSGTVDFNPGAGVNNLTGTVTYEHFILKLDNNGNFLWATNFSAGYDHTSINVDGQGNVLTTGEFSGTVDFDPSAGTYDLTSTGSNNIFILKLDSKGSFLWARNFGASLELDYSEDIVMDASGNVYTTGGYSGTTDFDPGPGTFNLTAQGLSPASDIFISKLNPRGDFVWAKSMGGTNYDGGFAMTLSHGTIYTVGNFDGTSDFDPGSGVSNLSSTGGLDTFVSALYETVIRYVKSDASGANNGTSWEDAYTDLQSALTTANSGDEVWVASGTYKPTTGTDRTLSFILKNGVAIYGGFAGTEVLLNERDPVTNITVLSGEIGTAGITDNSYHVVSGGGTTNTAVLDGFTVTAGNANGGTLPAKRGGGMYNDHSTPTLRNLTFVDNSAELGGGMFNINNSDPSLMDVTFTNNMAQQHGGGMYNWQSSPSLLNVTFNSNLADLSAGGLANYYGNPTLTNVTFSNNVANSYGGGIAQSFSSPTLTNVTFNENSAIIAGGGIANDASSPVIINSILYGDTGGEIYNFSSSSSPSVTYSIVQGGYAGTGNLNVNPHLGPLQGNGGFTQTMAVLSGSPAINAGNNASCPATDQRGIARPQGNQCDMGAYEYKKKSGNDTTGVFRPSNGALYLKNKNETGFADIQINYGLAGDYPVVGDWDGNGTVTIGIYRNGAFYLRNSNTIGFADVVFPFGAAGDQPIAGDWNGDGIDTIGVYRNGTFFLRNSNSGGAPQMSFALGIPGDVGIAGDWDGNGVDTTGVFRPSNGALYLKNTNVTGFADIQINYGLPGDKPVTGDWNNDGVDTIGIYRNGSFYLRNSNTIGFADIVFDLGIPGDMPIAGNWDGIP